MEQNRDFQEGTQEYQFMTETIKKKPRNVRGFFCKAAFFAAGGLLFGIAAAAVFSWLAPYFLAQQGYSGKPGESVRLVTSPQQQDEAGAAGEDVESVQGTSGDISTESIQGTGGDAFTESVQGAGGSTSAEALEETGEDTSGEADRDILVEYQQIYNRALEISAGPRKALVTVSNISDNSDILDNSLMSYGDTEGIIFLKNNSYLYILTNMENIRQDGNLLVTFSNAAAVTGTLCRTDAETGLAVVKAALSGLGEETQDAISVASFSDTETLSQASPVIAIGSPSGASDTVMYGAVTAVSSTLSVADAEYTLVTTNMQGTRTGSGFLLDTDGNLAGVIGGQETSSSQIIRAFSIMELKPLIEQLSNNEKLRYAGIRGTAISQEQSDALEIPLGIYVDSVDSESPAIEAGIQNGDIITEFDGQKVSDMLVYNGILQDKNPGEKVSVTVSRSNVDGVYVDLNLEIIVGTR